MPKRARDRRTTTLDALTARVDALTGDRKCVAIYIRDENGDPSMVLMADGCPVCREFRAGMAENAAKRDASRPKRVIPDAAEPYLDVEDE